ncbi:uncharacterized protein [Typha angustifolia]|uniref:uncharacterized protein n=1 Tax=Typha angustifolia TaxID=59011 RepID=UPI003C2FF7A9
MAPNPPPPSKRRRRNESGEKVTEESSKKESPLVVFAHGAGAPSASEWMLKWKKMVGDALGAIEVVTFDYPYISGGKRRAPPKAEKLVDHHLSVVKDSLAKYPGHPLVLMGKSMGSRVSCMVAATEDINVSAVICLGYPLKGINGAVRDEILLQLKVPVMFVQGSKDGLCPLDKLESTRKKMNCQNELHVIDGGDHSFKIGKKFQESTGLNQDKAEKIAVDAISEFASKSITEF